MSETTMSPAAKAWTVFDLNAKRRDKEQKPIPRVHDGIDGREYALYMNQPTEMPEMVARGFLRDPGFKVLDANGNHVQSLKEAQLMRDAPVRLAPDLVVAGVHELSTEALVTRAAQFPGGEEFSETSPRPNLVRFLVNAQKIRDNWNTRPDNAPDGRGMAPEEAAALVARGITLADSDAMSPGELEKVVPMPELTF